MSIDKQGRVVLPQAERERLRLEPGDRLELVPTPEGVLLERRRCATVTVSDDGLPQLSVDGMGTVSNDDVLAAIRAVRDGA